MKDEIHIGSKSFVLGEARLNKQVTTPIILLVLVVILFTYFAIAIGTMNAKVHNKYGGTQSQTVVMTAARNFAEIGFVPLKLTPRIAVRKPDWGLAENLYTHNPPLPYYLGGVIWKLGGESLVYFRLVNIISTGLFLAGAYLLFAQLFNPILALLVVIVMASQKTLYVINSTAPEAISDMFAMWSLVLLLLALQRDSKNARYLWSGSWILFFCCAYSVFDQIVSTQIIASAFILIYSKCDRWRRIILLATAPVVGQILHFLNNAWALGGFDKAYQDLAGAFLWRTLDIGRGTSYLEDIAGGIQGYPLWLIGRVSETYIGSQAFLIVFALILFFSIVAFSSRERSDYRNYARIVLVFALAGVSWWLLFPQQSAIHFYSFVGRHWILTHSLLLGGGLYFMAREIRNYHQQKRSQIGLAILVVLLIGTVFFSNVKQTVKFIQTAQRITWGQELTLLQDVSPMLPDAGLLLTSQQPIAQAAFLHQPRESFDLGEFDMALITTPELLGEKIASSCTSRRCFFLEPVGDHDQSGIATRLLESSGISNRALAPVQETTSYILFKIYKTME